MRVTVQSNTRPVPLATDRLAQCRAPLELFLCHGRNDPRLDMDDWGYDGPAIPINMLFVTYMGEFRLIVPVEDTSLIKELFRLAEWDDDELAVQVIDDMLMLHTFPGEPHPGPHYFGDWIIRPRVQEGNG